MAFEGLSSKLQNVFKKLGGKGKLSEKEVREAMREVKLALLEADVNFAVVKNFVNKVTERAVGSEVLESLTPAQQVIKIVNEELTALMGGTGSKIEFGSKSPSVILLAGLQGAGKTTMAGKLAGYLSKQYGKSPMLVACDIYRPAAIDQLKVVGSKVGVPVFERGQADPVETAKLGVEEARRQLKDLVIIDTAGRLHIDEGMMDEIAAIRDAVQPAEILLTIDAMTGQDAVNVAKAFNEKLELTGVIVTKLDGDLRGGAALSVKAVTGKPIKFSGTGEKLTDIEPFHPDRMASRILGSERFAHARKFLSACQPTHLRGDSRPRRTTAAYRLADRDATTPLQRSPRRSGRCRSHFGTDQPCGFCRQYRIPRPNRGAKIPCARTHQLQFADWHTCV